MNNDKSRLLTRDEILAVDDRKIEEVDVPEWGGKVGVVGLTGTERDELSGSLIDAKGQVNARRAINLQTRLPALCMVNEQGARLFTEADVARLGQKSAAALKRVFDAAQRLSGLSETDVAEMTKNSDSSQSDDSGLG